MIDDERDECQLISCNTRAMNNPYSHIKTENSKFLSKHILENSIELNDINDLDILIEDIGDAKYVLLGEASHGTHEYYT